MESGMSLFERCALPHSHQSYECGLIAEQDMPRHEVMVRDEAFGCYFANLCETADQGWVRYRNRTVKLDFYLENGNEMYSYLDPQFREDGSVALECSTLIHHRNGRWYFEVHATHIGPDGTFQEPPVGSPDVLPYDFVHPEASMIHYRVAYEATKLSVAA
jgi:hypothetical protein